MADDPDPPRKYYQFKPREFEIVNPPASATSVDNQPTDVAGHLRAADAKSTPRLAPLPVPQNDVHAILRDNAARADAAGLNDLTPKPRRRSRRKRDYWIVMGCGSAVFGTIIVKTGPNQPIPFIYGIAGVVMFNLGLAWVMWFVMDDY